MEREFHHYTSGETAIVGLAPEGLWTIKIWHDGELICDVITDTEQGSLLLDGFVEVDDGLKEIDSEADYDIGGSG